MGCQNDNIDIIAVTIIHIILNNGFRSVSNLLNGIGFLTPTQLSTSLKPIKFLFS